MVLSQPFHTQKPISHYYVIQLEKSSFSPNKSELSLSIIHYHQHMILLFHYTVSDN